MHTYNATIRWTRGDDPFANQKYSRGHRWEFDEGVTIPASASPHVVNAPWSVAAAVDPEEALVAALSSCHMLFFLSDASRGGFIVERYEFAALYASAHEQCFISNSVKSEVVIDPVLLQS